MLKNDILPASKSDNLIGLIADISVRDLVDLEKYLKEIPLNIFDKSKTREKAEERLRQLYVDESYIDQQINERVALCQKEKLSDAEQQSEILNLLNEIIEKETTKKIITQCPQPIRFLLEKIEKAANIINSSSRKELEGAEWGGAWLKHFSGVANTNANVTRASAITLIIQGLFSSKLISTSLNLYIYDGLFKARQNALYASFKLLTDDEKTQLDNKYDEEVESIQETIKKQMKNEQEKDKKIQPVQQKKKNSSHNKIPTLQQNTETAYNPLQIMFSAACAGGTTGAIVGSVVSVSSAPFTGGLSLLGAAIIVPTFFTIGFITAGLTAGLGILVKKHRYNKKQKELPLSTASINTNPAQYKEPDKPKTTPPLNITPRNTLGNNSTKKTGTPSTPTENHSQLAFFSTPRQNGSNVLFSTTPPIKSDPSQTQTEKKHQVKTNH